MGRALELAQALERKDARYVETMALARAGECARAHFIQLEDQRCGSMESDGAQTLKIELMVSKTCGSGRPTQVVPH